MNQAAKMFVIVLVSSRVIPAGGAHIISHWDGATADWSDASHWSSDPLVPNNGNGGHTYDAHVDAGETTVDFMVRTEELHIDGGKVLLNEPSSSLTANVKLVTGESRRSDITLTNRTFVSTDSARIGEEHNGNFSNGFVSTLTVSESSQFHAGTLGVGVEGTGQVVVESGAQLFSEGAFFGGVEWQPPFIREKGDGRLSIDGANSKWTNTGHISIGSGGRGTVQVTGGAEVTTERATIGGVSFAGVFCTGGSGTLLVDGEGSKFTTTSADNLQIGRISRPCRGFGSVTVSNGGIIATTGGFSVASSGELTLDHGTISNAGTGFISGALLGIGEVLGDVESSFGLIRPGLSDTGGILSIQGDYSQRATATMEFELAGTTKGLDYSVLEVVGSMTLRGGQLDVAFADDFYPVAGDSFDVLDFKSLTGSFDSLWLPEGIVWDTRNLLVDGSLVVSAIVDYSRNGTLGPEDYSIWRDTLGSTTDLRADGNGNQIIDVGDYELWKANYGSMSTEVVASAGRPVPEVATWLLMLIGTCATCMFRGGPYEMRRRLQTRHEPAARTDIGKYEACA